MYPWSSFVQQFSNERSRSEDETRKKSLVLNSNATLPMSWNKWTVPNKIAIKVKILLKRHSVKVNQIFPILFYDRLLFLSQPTSTNSPTSSESLHACLLPSWPSVFPVLIDRDKRYLFLKHEQYSTTNMFIKRVQCCRVMVSCEPYWVGGPGWKSVVVSNALKEVSAVISMKAHL